MQELRMLAFLGEHLDLLIAGVLILGALFVLVLNRLDLMPGGGMPFLIGAIIGVASITALNRAKARRLKREIKSLQDQIKNRQKQIDKATLELKDREKIIAQVKQEYEKALQQYKANALAYVLPRDKLENLSDAEIAAEFEKLL